VTSLIPARARILLATPDPVFGALCTHALEDGATQKVTAVTPRELLEAARETAPDFVVLDADGDDVASLKVLAAKTMLVTSAPIVFVSAYLAPGSPALTSLLQSVAAYFVQKPSGPSSLSLADGDGPRFAASLRAAFAAHEDADMASEALDAGWDDDEGGADD